MLYPLHPEMEDAAVYVNLQRLCQVLQAFSSFPLKPDYEMRYRTVPWLEKLQQMTNLDKSRVLQILSRPCSMSSLDICE